ncbi:sterol desaturase family protein, partial [Oceanospirillum sp. HFRX-1_2]
EIVLSVLIKNFAILLLGVPTIAVIIFEVLLNGMALFNHSNLALPEKADRLIRRLFVTPDMHRVHHSIYPREMHSNFGFNLSIWDRIFSSYVAQPKDGHAEMQIGQPNAGKLPTNNLLWLLGPALKQKTRN